VFEDARTDLRVSFFLVPSAEGFGPAVVSRGLRSRLCRFLDPNKDLYYLGLVLDSIWQTFFDSLPDDVSPFCLARMDFGSTSYELRRYLF
jgi:hypothetical protein